MMMEHFSISNDGPHGTIILVEDGAVIELSSTLHIDGVGRWGWSVCDGDVVIREVSTRGRFGLHELTLNGDATVIHYRIDERGRVASLRVYHSTLDV
jgi:hypothetical protein